MSQNQGPREQPVRQNKCCLMEFTYTFLCLLHMDMQLIDEECIEPHATNESEDIVAREANPTMEEVVEEGALLTVIEDFNVEEERNLSAVVDIETLRK